MKKINILKVHFPDLNEKELPKRKYLCSFILTLRNKESKTLMEEARKNRSYLHLKDKNDYVAII